MLKEPAWVDRYIGLPFRPLGRGWDGVDCYGLYWLIRLEEYGEQLPPILDGYEPADARLCEDVVRASLSQWRRLDGPEVGHAVVLRSRGVEAHVGVVIAPNMMIHTNDDSGRVHKDRLGGLAWPERRIVGYYAWEGSLC